MSEFGVEADTIPVQCSKDETKVHDVGSSQRQRSDSIKKRKPTLVRALSRKEITVDNEESVEYFFASDASAIIEHTNRVIFLEDDDVAAVRNTISLYLLQFSFPSLSYQ